MAMVMKAGGDGFESGKPFVFGLDSLLERGMPQQGRSSAYSLRAFGEWFELRRPLNARALRALGVACRCGHNERRPASHTPVPHAARISSAKTRVPRPGHDFLAYSTLR